jgi:hypothetical protein
MNKKVLLLLLLFFISGCSINGKWFSLDEHNNNITVQAAMIYACEKEAWNATVIRYDEDFTIVKCITLTNKIVYETYDHKLNRIKMEEVVK